MQRNSQKIMKAIPEFSTKTLFGIEKAQNKNPEDIPIVFLSQKYDSTSHYAKLLLKNYLFSLEKNPTGNISKQELERTKDHHAVDGLIDCQYCNTSVAKDEISIDHYVPYYFGGLTHYHNIKLCCDDCNRMKGAIHPNLMPISWGLFNDNLTQEVKPNALHLLIIAKDSNPQPEELKLIDTLIVKELEWRAQRQLEKDQKQAEELLLTEKAA